LLIGTGFFSTSLLIGISFFSTGLLTGIGFFSISLLIGIRLEVLILLLRGIRLRFSGIIRFRAFIEVNSGPIRSISLPLPLLVIKVFKEPSIKESVIIIVLIA
jgi:hypothetical protein